MSYKEKLTALAEELGVDVEVVSTISTIVESAIAEAVEEKEAEIKIQVEEAAKSMAYDLVEARAAQEAELKAQVKLVAEEFVQENESRFVQTEEYENMVAFVQNIQEAFASMFGGASDDVLALQEQVSQLQADNEQYRQEHTVNECADILKTMIAENNLSDMQSERALRLLSHTKPDTVDEFRAIAEQIIADVSVVGGDDSLPKITLDENKDNDETKEDLNESKSRIQSYLDFGMKNRY